MEKKINANIYIWISSTQWEHMCIHPHWYVTKGEWQKEAKVCWTETYGRVLEEIITAREMNP